MLKHVRLFVWLAIACAALAVTYAAPYVAVETVQAWQPNLSAAVTQSDSMTVTLQYGINDYSGSSDTYISEYDREATHPNDFLHLRAVDFMAPLLRFDLSGQIPDGAEIRQATIELFTSYASANPIEAQTFRVLRQWDVNQANWNQAADGVPWSSAGCNGLGTDREANSSDLQTLSELHAWYRFDVTAMARDWLNDPIHNYGLVVKSFGPAASEFDLASNEYPDSLARPKLVIVYGFPATITPTRPPTRIPTNTPTPVSPTPTRTPPPGLLIATLQEGVADYSGVQDTYLDGYFPDDGHGDSVNLVVRAPDVRTTPLQDIRAALLRFDVSSIPAGAAVYSATLELYCVNSGGQPLDIGAYFVQRPWSESQATWVQTMDGDIWAKPGCNEPGVDRAAEAEDVALVLEAFRWYRFNVTNMAQTWVSDGQRNNGVILKSWTDHRVEHRFASSEYTASALLRPRLIISYSAIGLPALVSLPLILRNYP
jgi:hypothetical protein